MPTERSEIPDKPYFKIGEAALLVGVKPSVLRFWETEFRTLRPEKTRSNQRLYTRKSIEKLRRIRELLYERGYTIAGAKKALREPPTDEEVAAAAAAAAAAVAAPPVPAGPSPELEASRRAIERAKKELRELLQLCDE